MHNNTPILIMSCYIIRFFQLIIAVLLTIKLSWQVANHLTKEQYKYVTMASGTQYVVQHMWTNILLQQFAINLDLLQVVVSYTIIQHSIFITPCTMYIFCVFNFQEVSLILVLNVTQYQSINNYKYCLFYFPLHFQLPH